MVSTGRKITVFAITAAALLALFFVAVNTGSLQVTREQLLGGLFVEYDDTVATIYDLRFPRIFIAMAGGAALAVSGALLQAVIRNPLADPGIIGVSSGASLAAVLVTAFAPALYYFTPLLAFAGGMIAFCLVYSLSWRGGQHRGREHHHENVERPANACGLRGGRARYRAAGDEALRPAVA